MDRCGTRTALGVLIAFTVAAVACSSSNSSSAQGPTITTTPSVGPSESGLYALDVATGESVLFLAPPEGLVSSLVEFVLSPDGTQLAFEDADADDRSQIFVMNADGTDLHQLTHEPIADSPAWSADGARIAFRGLDSDATYEIYVIDVASAEVSRITRETQDVEGAPSWAPDGRTIVYQVGEPAVLRSIDLATGETATIMRNAGLPDVSADGSRLVFNTWSSAKVTFAGIDGSDRTMLRSERDECCAKWSPNGERFAFIDLVGNIYVYEVTTGERTLAGTGGLVDWLDDDTLLVQV
jgi:Tol biopolymer transport system component